jgi:P-type Cu+ transporter
LSDFVPHNGNGDALLQILASAESASEHPLALAILEAAKAKGLAITTPSAFTAVSGKGLSAVVNGQAVLIGNEAWMRENNIALPELSTMSALSDQGKTVLLAAIDGPTSDCWPLRICLNPTVLKPSNNSTRWASKWP